MARIVIIGGGVLGLSLAYQLGRRGWRDVVVLEKYHLNAGATGRCGGGVRQQWSTSQNIELMKRSVALFDRMAVEIGENIWFRKEGYLFLAKTDEDVRQNEKNVRLQNEHGVPSKILDRDEVRSMCPFLNMEVIKGGTFNPHDGTIFPFSVVWAYAKGVKAAGNNVATHCLVTGLESKKNGGWLVQTTRGDVNADLVVNAAGAWSPEIGKMAGVDLPNYPEKHEVLVTESLFPFLKPNLVPQDSGLFVSQTMRGEILACLGVDKNPAKDYRSTFRFVREVSRLLTDLIPSLARVKVLRQWAGFYDITPDTNPILGPVEGVNGFVQCHGFMGHGFMMAPAISEIMADFLDKGILHPVLESCRLERFKEGGLSKEQMIIG